MVEKFQLFATPVIVDELDDAAALNAELSDLILARRSDDVGIRLSNRSGWHSKPDLPRWTGETGQRLIDHAIALANRHTMVRPGGSLRWTVDSWANVNDRGGFNVPHIHGGTFWSAVYYVRMGNVMGGELVLHDPRMPALRMHAPDLRFKEMGAEGKARIQPKEGRMVLFPGWLSHGVEPFEGEGVRISVAMNIRALPAFG